MKAILTYHSLDRSGSVVSTAPETLARHVAFLASGRVPVRTVDDLLASPGDAEGVAVTFDDGFVNFADDGWPLFRDHGLPVTLFVPSGLVGTSNRWDDGSPLGIPSMPLLDWDALGRLAEEGVTLAAHSHSHHDLRTVEPSRLADEIEACRDTIARETGRVPTGYAYPYGGHDDHIVRLTAASYAWACATTFRLLRPRDDRHRLPRLDAYYLRRPGILESFGTLRFRQWVRLRRWGRGLRETLAAPGSKR